MVLTDHKKELRKGRIGSSNAYDIVTNPQRAFEQIAMGAELDETESMRVGNWLEIPLIQWVADECRVNADRTNTFRVMPDGPLKDFAACNVDAWADMDGIIECKMVGRGHPDRDEYGETGTDQVSDRTAVQCYHQMLVSKRGYAIVAAAFLGDFGIDRRWYRVPWDDERIAMLLKAEIRFKLKHIDTGIAPDPNALPPLEYFKGLVREPGKIVDIDRKLALAWSKARIAKGAAGDYADLMDRAMLDAIGDAEIARVPNGGLYVKGGGQIKYLEQGSSPKADFAALRAAGLFEQYCSQTTHRQLRASTKE